MCSHVPNKGEQMVRYYGYYSNVGRGKREKQNWDELIPSVLESDESSKERRKNWARLIQKIYGVDPLTCPKCSGKMKVISVIENKEVIRKILKHLRLWEVKPRPPPRMAKTQPLHTEPHIDYSARPGANRLPIAACAYPHFKRNFFEYILSLIGLGQGHAGLPFR
jgi:hypothetical protein